MWFVLPLGTCPLIKPPILFYFLRGVKIQKIGQMLFPSAFRCTHLLTLLFGFMTTWCSHGMRVNWLSLECTLKCIKMYFSFDNLEFSYVAPTCEFQLKVCVCLECSSLSFGSLLLFTRPFKSSRHLTLSNIVCIVDWLLAAVSFSTSATASICLVSL